jgi:catechol 2,3-dioxygenase-like lactoylglutathione lyase family enzyme
VKQLAILLAPMLLAAPVVASAASPAQAQPPQPPPIRLKGTKIMVSDLPRSIAFYSSIFGLKVARSIAENPARPVNEVILTPDGTFDVAQGTWLVLKLVGPGDPPLPQDRSAWGQIVVAVPSTAAVAARAASARFKVREFQHGILVVSDPDGNGIEVLPASVP